MKRSADTFVFTREFGARLRDLRLAAGLTQLELARAMGRAGKSAGNLVSRLERGDERYPSFGLVADFLRGCRAGFADILDVLDLYTDLPTTQQRVFSRALAKVAATVPRKWQTQVTNYDRQLDQTTSTARPVAGRTMPDRMKRLERARKMAAAARRRYLYGQFLTGILNEPGYDPAMTVRKPLFDHGLEWFGIHLETRRSRARTREQRLARSEAEFARASQLPLSMVRRVQDAVRRHFAEMEMRGDLDWLPELSLDEYEARLLAPARKQGARQQLREDYLRKFAEYETARKAAVEQVWDEVQSLLDEAGVPQERRPVYRGAVGVCCAAALRTEPGSAEERRQIEEYILEPRWIRLGLDTAFAQKIAGMVLVRFRELAQSFPPDPRPKR
jgi:transcriptional regulator with XRE-family HTH domain